MKKNTAKNLFWGIVLILLVVFLQSLEFDMEMEDKQAIEDLREAREEQAFYEYHNN